MTQLMIHEDGVVKVYDETHKEYVRILFQLDKDDQLKVQLKVKECYFYGNKLYPKTPLNMRAVQDFVEEDLELSEEALDIARTTPSFANHFNEVVGGILESKGHEEMVPAMESYTNGYSFMGEAFVNFVTALVVYHMYPEETSTELTNYANALRSNDYLAGVSMSMGWSRYLTKMKSIPKNHTHYKKEIAASYKGLVGSLYDSNGMEKAGEIMEFVKNTVAPESTLQLSSKKNDTTPFVYTMLTVGGAVFGWMVCYFTLTTFHQKYNPLTLCYQEL